LREVSPLLPHEGGDSAAFDDKKVLIDARRAMIAKRL